MKMKNLKSLAESRRVRYGTLNIIFIAVVVAIVIVLNSIMTVLSGTFGWFIDMTDEELYTVSDELVALLDSVSEDAPIDIIFCCDKDKAESNFSDPDTTTGSALAYIHSTATQIEKKLDNVTVLYKDPINDHAFMKKFNQVNSQIEPSQSTIIVARRDANGEYGTMYRTYHATSFYTFSQEADGSNTLYGYCGERTFATAILSLTHDKVPSVYFVAGHGETIPYSTESDYKIPQIARVYLDCGFRVRYIFLGDDEKQFTCPKEGCGDSWGEKEIGKTKSFVCSCDTVYKRDEIEFNEPRTIPEDARAIIINNPTSDYGANETTKLYEYLINQQGTIMTFLDPIGEDVENHPLKNLHRFIAQQTGVTVVDNNKVTHSGSVSQGESFDFRGEISSSKAASTYLSALKNVGSSNSIFKDSGILEIDPKYKEGVSQVDADRITQSIIKTDDDAKFGDLQADETEEEGFNVLSVTAITTIKNNANVQSYFLVCPSTGFISDEYLSNTMYPNDSIMLALIHSTTASTVPVDLDFKTFANYQLDISAAQQSTVFICLITIMPLLAIVIGIVVIVRRKHR